MYSVTNGKKKPEGAFDLLKDARARKRQLESQVANDTYGRIKKGDLLFTAYHTIWWASMQARLSPGSLRQYGLSFDRRILPFLGHLTLNEITPEIVQQFVNSLEGLAPSYVAMTYSHLRSLFNSAVAQDFLAQSPCRGIILPRIRRTVKRVLEPSEIALLVDISNQPYRALFSVLGYSGVRIGEALALRRRHINFTTKEIRIEEAWDTNCRIFGIPKTDAGIRTIPMLEVLEKALHEYIVTLKGLRPDDLLFPSPNDKDVPLSYQTIRGVFVRGLETAGLPHVGIHSLRHSFVSVLLSAGVSIPEITNCVGHSDPTVTLRVYSHRLTTMRGASFRRADDLFRSAN